MKKTQSKKTRYIVTYTDPQISISESSEILGISSNSMLEGVASMATDKAFDASDVFHFSEIGSTAISLSEEDADTLRNRQGVMAVEEDVEVFALQDEENDPYAASSQFYGLGYEHGKSDVLNLLLQNVLGLNQIGNTSAPTFPFPGPRPTPPFPFPPINTPFPRPPFPPLPRPFPPIVNQPIPWNMTLVNAPKAWAKGVKGDNVKVAVLDTGIAQHPDLIISGGACFIPNISSFNDGNGHGTHCAGIIGARNNAIGVVGVAPNAKLYAVKVLSDQGSGQTSWILAGISWAIANRMDVISMSLGSPTNPSPAYQNAIQQAINAGITVVCASGNWFQTPFPYVGAPANSHPGIVAVGAVDANKLIAPFSSRGSAPGVPNWNQVSLVAPGVQVNSTYLNNTYRPLSGTSMACPHVAGAAALIKQRFPTFTPLQVKKKLMATASDLGVPGNDIVYGSGLLNCDLATQ